MDFFAVSFVVGIDSCKDARLLLAYLNGADAYTKLQLILFEFNDMNSLKSLFLKKSYR